MSPPKPQDSSGSPKSKPQAQLSPDSRQSPPDSRLTVLLATGDRSWSNRELVHAVFSHYDPPNTVLIHGYADGLDEIAAEEARLLQWSEIRGFPAQWNYWRQRGAYRAAGPQRNKVMLTALLNYYYRHLMDTNARLGSALQMWDRPPPSKVRLRVLGFHDDIAASKGTKDMLEQAAKMKEKRPELPLRIKLYTSKDKPIRIKRRKQFL